MNGFFGPDVSPSGGRVIRKVLPELRIALKRRQHIKKDTYEKSKTGNNNNNIKKDTYIRKKHRQHIKKTHMKRKKSNT